MEKLLKSGGAFGGKGLSDTFKKIRGEIQQQQDVQMVAEADGAVGLNDHGQKSSAQKSVQESVELDDMNNMNMME